VEGGELPHVIDVVRALEPDVGTEKRLAAASSAVVVDDGSGFWETCGTAEALGKRGLQVHLVTPAGTVAGSVPGEAAAPLVRRLRWLGVNLLPLHRVSAIEAGKVSVYDVVRVAATRILEERELPADIVVYHAGKRAVTELAVQLEARVPELHLVGDCVSPRRINHAVLEGHRVGRSL
jgi:2,4-dienoyl-CoA reductase (NADPH2)